LAFAPDGRRLLTWSTDKFVRVWDAARGTLVYSVEHSGKTDSVAVSRDGALLASSCWGNNEVRVTDFATGKLLAPPLPHPDWAFSVDFSPDGGLLVTGCRDSIARVWYWRAGRLACPPLEHENEVHVARFTLDGRRVLTGSDDATARVWDSGDGKPVTPPIRLAGMGWSMALDSTGTHAVVGGLGGSLGVIALGNLDAWESLPGEDAESYAELLSCRRIEAGGDQSLTTQEWLNRYDAARAALPALFAIDWTVADRR
jgi:WD40 repeat protein